MFTLAHSRLALDNGLSGKLGKERVAMYTRGKFPIAREYYSEPN